ncbi:hypothetical protein [Fodinibius sp. Rm-B-1B1-1]|uniref:hypothetical protein n=1 Tax=Fodinibius alkaliphilus TaxID=3140241 RepID=UPI003159E693
MRIITISFLVILLASCRSSLPPAEPSINMMDNADTIILTFDEAPSQAYQNFEVHLGNMGFTVLRSNEQPMTLETRYKQFDPTILRLFGSYSMKINASVKDSALHITGTLASGTEVENAGGKNSPVKSGWNQLVSIAREFPHRQLFFSRNE